MLKVSHIIDANALANACRHDRPRNEHPRDTDRARVRRGAQETEEQPGDTEVACGVAAPEESEDK